MSNYIRPSTGEVITADRLPEVIHDQNGNRKVWLRVPDDATELVETIIANHQEMWDIAAQGNRGLLTSKEVTDRILEIQSRTFAWLINHTA